jgi:DNA-binding NarL/FixJ family response regulator
MIRVLLADDHAVVRAGLEQLLDGADDIEVVGRAADGDEAVELTLQLLPDVVLMDLSMPGIGGVEATRRIVAATHHSRVVALTSFSEPERVLAVLDAGACGYLLKDIVPDELIRAIRSTAAGHAALDPRAADIMLARFSRGAPAIDLTPRERDVLTLLAGGHSNKQIGKQLSISEATVKAHMTSVFRTLGVRDRTQAALWAHGHGFLTAGAN